MDFHPQARARLIRWFLLFVVLAAIVFGTAWWRNQELSKSSQTLSPNSSNIATKTPVSFDKNQHSVNDPASIWVVVNKGRLLPSDYVPAGLAAPNIALRLAASSPEMKVEKTVAAAMEKLFTAATNSGLHLMLASGYRSYAEQVSVYSAEVQNNGQAVADNESARPGHSEHQTGLAADLEPASRNCEVMSCFGDTSEGKWLIANAYKYGFIIRYPKDKTSITGYAYEPWHIRYVGLELAAEINKTGQTLEQLFNLTTYSDYPVTSYKLGIGR